MNPNDKQNDIIEEIDDDELQELVLEAQRQALSQSQQDQQKAKHPFPKWLFWLIASMMIVNTFAVFFEVFSIPAIEFVKTSARLSAQEDIAAYKKSIVVITTTDGKGTGFSISSDGSILTNYHVIEGNQKVTVSFPDKGLFTANVVHTYPSIDLAVLEIEGEDLPYLELADHTTFTDDESIYFIGNPLKFTGIANEGTIIDYLQLKDWDEPVVMMKAPVYRGNSGSPVLNLSGQVIGVVFATLEHETYGKVGLFVPIDAYYSHQED
ncbi:S1C family serine protease [Sporosarcina sp. NPDC096371]|uniref:S1C family serine protease n=1 Tax=Sporosarcina sp. NPDC096371 TaxID=3364530 RepID=UPI00381CCD76